MSGKHGPHAVFSSGQEDNVVQHRPVSRLAVASMLLGLVSAAAIANPLAWCVPIVGVTLAIAALRTLSTENSMVLGRKAALAGLVMALLFGSCGMTRYFARQQWLYRQARPLAQRWIELVREGRLYEAHQLHSPQRDRISPGGDLDDFYQGEDGAQSSLEVFFEQPPLSEIVRIGRRGQLRFEGDEDIDFAREGGAKSEIVILRYAIDYEEDGKPQTLSFLVSVARKYDAEHREARWNVHEVIDPDAPDL
jgi:hypothetical protein